MYIYLLNDISLEQIKQSLRLSHCRAPKVAESDNNMPRNINIPGLAYFLSHLVFFFLEMLLHFV